VDLSESKKNPQRKLVFSDAWISQNQKKCMADRHQSTKVSQRPSKKPPEPRATLEEGASGGAEKERKRGRRGKRHKRAERNGEKERKKEREKKDEEREKRELIQ
jgi:hypothetical protein